MRTKCFLGVLAIVLFVCGCSPSKDMATASAAVTQFHAQLDRGEFDSIYMHADPRLREATKRDDFISLLSAVHRKLGPVQGATREGFLINYNTLGYQIRLTYSTKFTEGNAEEIFNWAKSGDSMQLLGYNINSNALITK